MANPRLSDKQDWNRLDDAILIKAHLKGEQEAFEVLFKKHYGLIARLIFSIVKDASLVDDIAQDVFFIVYRNLPRFRAESSFKTWIYRIAVNEAVRQWNRNKRWIPVAPQDFENGSLSSTLVMVNRGPSPERVLLEGEERQMISEALAELKSPHRVILSLYYLEELTIQEIAEILEIPPGSVKSRLFYARENLRKVLEPVMGERKPDEGHARHRL